MGDRIPQQTVCCYTQRAIDTFIAKGERWSNRVRQRAFERHELLAGKLARAVLGGRDGGNTVLLPGKLQHRLIVDPIFTPHAPGAHGRLRGRPQSSLQEREGRLRDAL